MPKIRLGLISESLHTTQIPLMPYHAIEAVFRDIDGILHTGEAPSENILDMLSEIAPTQAVTTMSTTANVQDKRVMTFGDIRIGLTHGYRHPLVESYFSIQQRLGNIYAGGRHLLDTLPTRFAEDDVDVIVFGHLHIPLTLKRDDVLLINPGAVYTISEDLAQWELLRETNPDRRYLLETYLRNQKSDSYKMPTRSTVGILEINEDYSISAKIQPLPQFVFA
ncbi:MAG: metallophosphoesterase family protein [Chloroflexota bacterium]